MFHNTVVAVSFGLSGSENAALPRRPQIGTKRLKDFAFLHVIYIFKFKQSVSQY